MMSSEEQNGGGETTTTTTTTTATDGGAATTTPTPTSSSSPSSSPFVGCKLTYFNLPGRGESIRLALMIANIPFEEHRIELKDWKNVKPYTPWGYLPFVTLSNGTVIAQQRAILRLIGKCHGMYPSSSGGGAEDDVDIMISAAKCDELMDALDELQCKLKSTGSTLGPQSRAAARSDAARDGFLATGLDKVDKFIASNGKDGHAVGGTLTIADIVLFTVTSILFSGFFDGLSKDGLDHYPFIQGCRKIVSSHPEVRKHYDERSEGEESMSEFETFFKEARDITTE